MELSVHPQKKRILQRHPNWGHPILRSVDKKRRYPTVEQAQAELTLLQQEYPHAAIPGPGKLYVMIFGRTDADEKKRVKKYVLEIRLSEEGGYYINCALNSSQPKKKPAKASAPDTQEGIKPVGEFTAKLALKRNKKKK
jgi:hypothetical protein